MTTDERTERQSWAFPRHGWSLANLKPSFAHTKVLAACNNTENKYVGKTKSGNRDPTRNYVKFLIMRPFVGRRQNQNQAAEAVGKTTRDKPIKIYHKAAYRAYA